MSAMRATEQYVAADPITDVVFRSVFRDHAAGVVVVTAPGANAPVGFTATSLTSVSLQPPLVSVAISRGASAWAALSGSRRLAVHFLGHEQHWLAQRFATSGIDRFGDPVRWSWSASGEPVLHECAAYLCCTVEKHVPAGDHVLVLARVHSANVTRSGSPLVYHDGTYASVTHDGLQA